MFLHGWRSVGRALTAGRRASRNAGIVASLQAARPCIRGDARARREIDEERQAGGAERMRIGAERAPAQPRRAACLRHGRGKRILEPGQDRLYPYGAPRSPSRTMSVTSSSACDERIGSDQGIDAVVEPLLEPRGAGRYRGRQVFQRGIVWPRKARWRIRAAIEARARRISTGPRGGGAEGSCERGTGSIGDIARIAGNPPAIVAFEDHAAADRRADEEIDEVSALAAETVEKLGNRRRCAVIFFVDVEMRCAATAPRRSRNCPRASGPDCAGRGGPARHRDYRAAPGRCRALAPAPLRRRSPSAP